MAQELKSVIDEIGLQQIHLVGESFGGVVAQHFTLQYPSSVKSLALLSSLAKTSLPPEIQWKLDHLLPIVATLGNYFPVFAQYLFANIHVEDVLEPHEPQFAKQLFIKEASAAHFYSVMSRIKIISKLDIADEVKAIEAPTLLIYGDDDHFTKKDSIALNSLIPNSELVSMPGGHLPHVTSPLLFANIIKNFIERHV